MSETCVHDLMLAVYRRQMPERVPVAIYDRYLPRGAVERRARGQGLGIIQYWPVVSMAGPAWHLYPGYVSEARGADFRVDHLWDDAVLVERRTWSTPLGSVWQEMTYDAGGVGSEHIRKHYIAGREDYRVLAYLVEHSVLRRNEEAIRARQGDLGGDGVVWGRLDRSPYQKCLIELAGPERFLIDLHEDPEPVLELMEALARTQEKAFAMALDSAVEVLWQPDNITSAMTPPEAYRKYCLPVLKRRAELARQAGKPYVVHIDGRVRALLPLVAESGFDVLESFSLPDIGGDVPLGEAQAALPQTAVLPNVPANWAMRPPAEMQTLVRRLLADALPGAAMMLQISEDVPANCWQTFVESVMAAMSETCD